MKKISVVLLVILFSCSNDQLFNIDSQPTPSTPREFAQHNLNQLLKKIKEDTILSRSILEAGVGQNDSQRGSYEALVNDPEAVINDISSQENAEDQFALINSVLGSSTAEDVYLAMGKIDAEMAETYREKMDEIVAPLVSEISFSSRILVQNGRANLANIKLNIFNGKNEGINRALFDDNFEWDTIWAYVGFSAVTTAGLLLYRYTPEITWFGWFPVYTGWLRWIGLAASHFGGGIMINQINRWILSGHVFEMITFAQLLPDVIERVKVLYSISQDKDWLRRKAYEYLQSRGFWINNTTVEQVLSDITDEITTNILTPLLSISIFIKRYLGFSSGNDYGWRWILTTGGTSAVLLTVIFITPELMAYFAGLASSWKYLSEELGLSIVINGAKIL